MDTASLILVAILIGAVALRIAAPRLARVLGWLVIAASIIGSIHAYKSMTGGSGVALDGIGMLFGIFGAFLILAIGLPVGGAMIWGAPAAKPVTDVVIGSALDPAGTDTDVAGR